MKVTNAQLQIAEDGKNQLEGRAAIEKLLAPLQYGFRIVDTDRGYWVNNDDTLVFEIDGEEVYRFGGKYVAEAMNAIATLISEGRPDEVDSVSAGSKIVYRLWWD